MWKELKNLLMKVKEESEKAGLKLNIQQTKIMASGPIMLWQIDGEEMKKVTDFIFLGSKITADSDYSHETKMLATWKKNYDKPRQDIKKQRHHFAHKSVYSQNYGFSSSHVQIWELDHKEGWAPKSWSFWTVVLQKTLKSLLDSKEIKPVNSEGNQPWIFIRSAEAEAPILWPPGVKNWLNEDDPDAGKDWGQEEKGVTEDEMVGCHHQLNGHAFEQTLGYSEGQGSLLCCSPLSCWESDTT